MFLLVFSPHIIIFCLLGYYNIRFHSVLGIITGSCYAIIAGPRCVRAFSLVPLSSLMCKGTIPDSAVC